MASSFLKTRSVKYFITRYNCSTLLGAVELAAQNERERLFKGFQDYCKIPVDVVNIAKRKHLQVEKNLSKSDPRSAVILSRKNDYLVKIDSDGALLRDRWSLAHEIGHTLFRKGMKHQIGVLGKKEIFAEEYICKMFANALLMPPGHLRQFIEEIQDEKPWKILKAFEDAGRRFQVSLPALISRMGQVKTSPKISFIVLNLSYFPNKHTKTDPCLRINTCSPVGELRHIRTWNNRSASGLKLLSAEKLFNSWSKGLGGKPERTGGRYIQNENGGIIMATPKSLNLTEEKMCFSVLRDGKWYKEEIMMMVTNCLYVRKGWRENNAYIISIVKLLEKPKEKN